MATGTDGAMEYAQIETNVTDGMMAENDSANAHASSNALFRAVMVMGLEKRMLGYRRNASAHLSRNHESHAYVFDDVSRIPRTQYHQFLHQFPLFRLFHRFLRL